MALLLSMLPLYLFGNLHCIGMCGPLVMMIGQHRFRYFYFLGRTLSFTLAGTIAGEAGAVLNLILVKYHIPAVACFAFGFFILSIGITSLMGMQYPGYEWFAKKMKRFNSTLTLLMLQDRAWPSFLFGFFTLALPCGQTLVVFSACALAGDPYVGMLNGFIFAILTSPSLFFAMNAHMMLKKFRKHYNILMGAAACLVGILALCRGFAELQVIPHLVVNPQSPSYYHIVLY
jgi:sulfite exporter TauE/SafE